MILAVIFLILYVLFLILDVWLIFVDDDRVGVSMKSTGVL